MAEDGLVLLTYDGEIYFLRGRNLGQYEGKDVKAIGFLRQDEAGLYIMNVESCEVLADDYRSDDNDSEGNSSIWQP